MTTLSKPIFWILFVALALRLWGITYGLPLFLVNDERANVYGALKMIELKTLVPAWHEAEFRTVLNYLPVPSYLYLIVLLPVLGMGFLLSSAPDLAAYQSALTLDPTVIFITARVLIALLGVVSIWATYRAARITFGSERAALLAAIFLALSFYHLQVSHVTRHWMPALAAITLAWLAAAKIGRGAGMRTYLWGGLAAGLGVGSNTASAVAVIPLALAHFFRQGGELIRRRIFDRRLLSAVAVFLAVALGAILLYPYGLTQGEIPGGGPADTIAAKFGMLGRAADFGSWAQFLGFFANLLLTYEPTLVIAAAAGAVFAWQAHRRWLLIAAIYALAYVAALHVFFNIIARGVLFLLPFMAAFAGYGTDRFLLRFERHVRPTRGALAALYGGVGLLLFAWPLAMAVRYDQLLARADTRLEATKWIYAETPPDARILADAPYLRLTNTKRGVRALEAVDPAGLRVQDRTLLALPDDAYPAPAREVLNLHFVGRQSPTQSILRAAWRERGYRYLVIESSYEDLRDLRPEARALLNPEKRLARFAPFENPGFERALDLAGEIDTVPPWQFWTLDRFGLIVDVYAL